MRIADQAYNRHRVLKSIRSNGPLARTELAHLTGLSGATITDVTSDLIGRGLVREERTAVSGRGRPRMQLSVDPQGGIVIGAALLADGSFSSSFVDLAGNRLHSSAADLGKITSLPAFASRIADLLEAAIAESGIELSGISRVAISLPALIDSTSGVVHFMTTFEEEPCPFADPIADRLRLPVTLENDSTCLARAEHWFGSAQSVDNFSMFHIDMWVDCAQYVDGMPRVGGNGFNSEIGHVKTDFSADARICLCGSRGCLANYGSIYGILLGGGKITGVDLTAPVDLLPAYRELIEAASAGDKGILALFIEAGRHLGIVIANHINAFDPANVLVLMPDPRFMELVRPSLEQTIAQNVFKPLGRRTNITIDVVDDDWRWKGAAAHALEQTYLGVTG